MSIKRDLRLRPVSRQDAARCIERWHYSGKAYPKSQVHFGVYWRGELAGALCYGDPLDRRRVLGLVRDTPWEGMTELNRMALRPDLPKNAESRAIAISLRLLARHASQLEWVLSFADATRCGDGTIYRATGWLLTQIKPNGSLWRFPDGRIWSDVGICTSKRLRSWVAREAGCTWAQAASTKTWRAMGAEPLQGYQLRYLYPLRPDVVSRLTCPVLDYAAIDAAGAGMYKGCARAAMEQPGLPASDGGSTPTRALDSGRS